MSDPVRDNPPENPVDPELEIRVTEAAARHAHAEDGFMLIDIREDEELAIAAIDGATHIPMDALATELARRGIAKDTTLALLCRTGNRTITAARALRALGYTDARSVAGGIHGWSDRLDPSLEKYGSMTTTRSVTLTLAHSPDADDLVMWWPLVGVRDASGEPVAGALGRPRIETGRYRFELVARDVEELNKAAIGSGEPYDITAVSCAAYPMIADRYAITRSGASFGEGYGPRVVVREDSPLGTLDALSGADALVAIPGEHTSAAMTLRLLAPGVRTEAMLFSEIPEAVARGSAQAGVLIHEAQLTFADSGLRALGDLGRWWHDQTRGDPLPLGLNVIARSLDERCGPGSCDRVSALLSRSIAAALEDREASRQYLRLNSADKPEWNDDALVDRYLEMYVSPMTLDMGERGRAAIERFLARGASEGLAADPGPITPV